MLNMVVVVSLSYYPIVFFAFSLLVCKLRHSYITSLCVILLGVATVALKNWITFYNRVNICYASLIIMQLPILVIEIIYSFSAAVHVHVELVAMKQEVNLRQLEFNYA